MNLYSILGLFFSIIMLINQAQADDFNRNFYERSVSAIEANSIVLKSAVIMEESYKQIEINLPSALLREAEAIVIIPNLLRVAFIIGGSGGTGVMLIRDKNGIWTNPSFITLASGSIGLQIGANASDIVIVFMQRDSIRQIEQGKFKLGADIGMSVGIVGAGINASTDFRAASYAYSRSQGVFAGVSLEGALLDIDPAGNQGLYGLPYTAQDIFSGKVKTNSKTVQRLQNILSHYERHP
ncbi:lipid-binding SYLF domain-containing protein [Beggiatoa leptomitoformis]|uniref:Ysc84 actin-binding domain-containing protein n=1 Tax=Beggiatoa leptomitoformis TaxID=288004 RepID=A0A2N9YIN7_9GAMM|nr:lipid-binding SYLF domain-containing protein [Beggiatoa leptomitoformis]ALG69365.2 hypothetical protein AL038_06535 [Beggiatoa leptomitoformis]AUI70364.2 hypothetical protein BLE401_17770 [Beggiatoa leptomitoformis]